MNRVEIVLGTSGGPVLARFLSFDQQFERTVQGDEQDVVRREVAVQAWSRDRKKMLAWAGGEADPGVLYFFDVETGAMQAIKAYRPSVDARLLARPEPVSYTARDGTLIRGYLTLPKGRDPKNPRRADNGDGCAVSIRK